MQEIHIESNHTNDSKHLESRSRCRAPHQCASNNKLCMFLTKLQAGPNSLYYSILISILEVIGTLRSGYVKFITAT